MLYLHVGRILKNKLDWFMKNQVSVCCIAGVLWGMCLQNNIYIEMATRSYPFYWISIIEAGVASLCIIYLSMIMCSKEMISFVFWVVYNS